MAPTYSDPEFQYDHSKDTEEEAKPGGEPIMESNSTSRAVEFEEAWMEGVETNDDTIFGLDEISNSRISHARADHDNLDLKAFQAARLAEIQARSSAMSSA